MSQTSKRKEDGGFRPNDEEIVGYYLARKVLGKPIPSGLIQDVDPYKFAPWDLPALAAPSNRHFYFFFRPLDTRYPHGSRANRNTPSGYWKSIGVVLAIKSGTKRTLVYHQGRLPKGERTDWVMHEYGLLRDHSGLQPANYVICKVFVKGFRLPVLPVYNVDDPMKTDDALGCTGANSSNVLQGTNQLSEGAAGGSFSLRDVVPAAAGGLFSVSDLVPESDSESDCSLSEAELVLILQKLDTDQSSTSLMPNISTEATSSGQSVHGSVQPEVMGNSSMSTEVYRPMMSSYMQTGGQDEASEKDMSWGAYKDVPFHLESISVSDAWELFCHQVGHVNSPVMTNYAEVSAVGSALIGKPSAEKQIKFSPGTNDSLNPHIQYCYDRLESLDVKTCFLYSALVIGDKQIHPSVLAKCFLNQGLLGSTTKPAYNRAMDIIQQLIKASLLEANDETMMVEMHDETKASAIAILSSSVEGSQMFLGNGLTRLIAEQGDNSYFDKVSIKVGTGSKEPPQLQEWGQHNVIFLMDSEFSSLPNIPTCGKLVSLFLQRNRCLRVIPASFFQKMPILTNLDLSKTRIRSLPDCLFNIICLRVLLIRHCDHLMVLPPAIGQLTALEVLDLHGTYLKDLPDTISKLRNLINLRVSFYGSMNRSEYKFLPTKMIGDGIISGLQLKQLNLCVYPGDRRWAVSESKISKELTHLRLSAIHFHFFELENLDYFLRGSESWKNGEIREFNFIVGHDFKRAVRVVTKDAKSMHNSSARCLKLVNSEIISCAVKEVVKRASSLYLDHDLSFCCLSSDLEIDNTKGLRICILSDCPKITAILKNEHGEGEVIFPFIEYLSINSLWNLESIIVGHHIVAKGTFGMLKSLSMRSCPKISFVFTCSMANNIPLLEELVIEDCASLKYIFIQDNDINIDDLTMTELIERDSKVDEFSALPHLKVLRLHCLPNLLEIRGKTWPNVEYMSFYNCPILDSLGMTEEDVANVKEIIADSTWWDLLKRDEPVLWKKLGKFFTQITKLPDDL